MIPPLPVRTSPILVVALAATARAGGFGIPEIGIRETAMGAVIGRPDDGSAIYHDPAGLVLSPGWRVYFSAGLVLPKTQLRLAPWDQSDQFLGASAEPDGYYASVAPSVAFAVVPMLAVTGEILPGRLCGGAAIFVGNATGAAFHDDSVARYHLLDGYVIAPQLMAAAAYRLRDDLAVGASLGVVNVRVHGRRDIFPVIMGYDLSATVGTKPELVLDGSGWAPAWSIGAFGKPHPKITWGAALTGRIDATLAGPIKITYSDDAAVPGDTLVGQQKTSFMLPWALAAGANVDITPQLEVGTEARYWLYHQYKQQRTDVVGVFFLRELDTPKNFHDSWEISGGVRVHDLAAAPQLELMAGANYDTTPEPSSTLTLDQPLFTHYGVHAGARYQLGRYRVGASYTHYWYDVPTIGDSITLPPTNLQGHGDAHIITLSVEAAL